MIIYPTSSLLLMLSVAMVMGYNCRAMTSHAECDSIRESQCSSHKIMVHRRQVTAEMFENSTATYDSSCDCVYCSPSAYELNTPLACKLTYVRNAGDCHSQQRICIHFSQTNRENECSICLMLVYARIMPFTSCL